MRVCLPLVSSVVSVTLAACSNAQALSFSFLLSSWLQAGSLDVSGGLRATLCCGVLTVKKHLRLRLLVFPVMVHLS